MLAYDERRLIAELGRLSPTLRVAFAAACAERLMPAYRNFRELTGRGDVQALTSALDRIWDDLVGARTTTDSELSGLLEAVMEQVPHEDDEPWVLEQAAAEDGAAAVVYSIRCRQGGAPEEAACAGHCVYEALDHFVINRENIDTNKPGSEQRVLSDSLVQAELARQRRDLDELLTATEHLRVLKLLRERAKAEGAEVFG